MFTTRPQCRSSMAGITARVQRKAPVALTAISRFQSSSDVRLSGIDPAAPALLTSTETGPTSAAAAARPSTPASLVTSHTTARARCPRVSNSAAWRSTWSRVRAARTTGQPAVGERARGGGADAPACAGHHRDAPFPEAHHG